MVVTAAVVAFFFLWPVPEPKILITSVSPVPKNGERVKTGQFIELSWEALYERPRQGLMAEVFVGKDKSSLTKVAQDLKGTLSSSSEGIFSFDYDYKIDPHSKYWWKVRVYTPKGKSSESEVWSFVLLNNYPDKPELTPPSVNLANVPLRELTLSWTGGDLDGDELVYDVYFGREPRLDEKDLLLRDVKQNSVELATLKRLDYSTKYYWKVVARDPSGEEAVSKTEYFTTQIRADLPAITPATPRNGASDFDPDIGKLSWNTSLPLDYYPEPLYFDVYIAEGQSKPTLVGTTDKTEIPLPSIKGHTAYTWYIVVRDASTKEKRSDQWIFKTINRPPTIDIEYPDLDTEATTVPVNWTLTDKDNDTLNSEVFFGELGKPQLKIASGKMNSVFLSGLSSDKQYSLIIKASDGQGGETEKELLLTPGNRPPTVSLLSPANGDTLEPTTINFVWFGEDPDDDSLHFDLYLSSSDGVQKFTEIKDKEYTLKDLKENTDYTWYIEVRDERGGFSSSVRSEFSTIEKSLETVTALWPEPGRDEVKLSQTEFSWTVESEPANVEYVFTLASDPEMKNIVFQRKLESNTLTLTQELKSNTQYFWRVDLTSGSTFRKGERWTFKSFNAPPVSVEPNSPVDGAIEISTDDLKLSWDAVDRDGTIASATVYLLQSDGEEVSYVATESSLTVEALLPGRKYTWWVEVEDDGGKLLKSAKWNFTTGNRSPSIKFTSPARMYLEGARPPLTFQWELNDPEGEDMKVRVFMHPTDQETGNVLASGINLASYTVESLEEGREYLLTVTAQDMGGKQSEASVQFKSHWSPIGYKYPVPGGLYIKEKPFEWVYSFPNSGFIFRMYDDNFNPMIRTKIQQTEYTPEVALEEGRKYYWAVSVLEDGEEYSAGAVSFLYGSGQELALVAPEDEAVVDSVGTTLSWRVEGSSTNVARVELFFGESGKLSSRNVSSNSFETGPLSGGKTYQWYVRLVDSSGRILESEIRTFSTLNRPPVVSLLSPANGSQVNQNSVDLSWTASDTDSEELSFALFLGRNDELLQLQGSFTSRTYKVSNLTAGTYRWYVRASDGQTGVDSQINSFTVASETTTVDGLLPTHGSTDVGSKPTLSWSVKGSPGGGEYRVYLGSSVDEMTLIGRTFDYSLTYKADLNFDKTYYWKVELWKDNRLVSSSRVSTFTTVKKPVTTQVSAVDRLAMYINGELTVVSFDDTAGVSFTRAPYRYQGKASPVINGELVYVIDGTGKLTTLRLSGDRLESLNSLNTNTNPEKLIFEAGYLWLLDTKSAGAVNRITLGNDGIPQKIETLYKDWTTPVDMFVVGDRIYLADALSGVKILEKTGDKYTDVTSRFSVPLDGYARAVIAKDGVVFSGEAGMNGGLKVIDLVNSKKSSFGNYYIVLKLALEDEVLFAITDRGVSIIDIGDPTAPVNLGDLEISQANHIEVAGRLLAIKTADKVLVYDILKADSPILISE